MPFGDPSQTAYDVRFTLLGFPLRIQPFFWLIAVLLSQGPTGGEPVRVLLWVVAMLLSIIVHELGHAVLLRRYGGRPSIVLYGFGGLAYADGARLTPWRQVIVSLAGPLAGFLLAGLVWLVANHTPLTASRVGADLAIYLLLINLFWGLFNLLPIYPLDGGQVSRELLTMVMPPRRGIVVSLWLSMICCAVAGACLWASTHSLWNLLLMIGLAYSNFQTLQAYRGSRGGGY